MLVRAHVNPSAECTIVLGRDLSVRAVLAGWPVVTFADGRLVYQRNQVHFAPVHPVALGLWDPRRPRDDVSVYPRPPYQAVRRAHVERMRARYADDWCRVRNHPCEPDRFDERLAGEVVADARGDALAFVLAWEVETEAAGPPAPDASAARGVTTAEAVTEVVYVYSGLRRPGTMRHRELLRRDFEARFGPGCRDGRWTPTCFARCSDPRASPAPLRADRGARRAPLPSADRAPGARPGAGYPMLRTFRPLARSERREAVLDDVDGSAHARTSASEEALVDAEITR